MLPIVCSLLMTALTSGIGLLPLALAAGEPGKEILYPIATVIVGGLLTSTLAEFFVRPALFWTIGKEAGKRIVKDHQEKMGSNALGATSTEPHRPVVAT